ncbi:cytochrome P450 [Rhizoctonia solani]|nr:cytochrome P450 [Rhizoctonia solani]
MSRAVFLSLSIPAILIIVDIIRKKRRALPPGPSSYPLIGQLLSAPASFAHVEYRKLSRELKSDIISFEFLGNTIIVLNSAESTNDLLDKRSAIYSSRTSTPMIEHEQLLNWKDSVPLAPYGDGFRAHRRVFNTWLNKNASSPMLQYDGVEITSRVLKDQFDLLAAASVMKATYGYQVSSPQDSYVTNIKKVEENLTKCCLPTRKLFQFGINGSSHMKRGLYSHLEFMVNILPFLVHVPNWVPGTGWKNIAKEWRRLKDQVLEDTFQWTKLRMDEGVAEPSIIQSYLEDLASRGEKLSEENASIIKNVGVSLFAGGTTTIATSLEVFILAMLLFPNVQRKAQEEIDYVIGLDRLPEMNDLKSLPYLGNLVQEVLRWQIVFPLGIPHTCTEDNVYRGYLIPKGAVVIGNAWAISRDETLYDQPEKFNPDRFNDPSVPPAPAFGWGRRKCAGFHYAESLLSISIASILATFNITMAKDNEGHYLVPSVADTPGFEHQPLPFTCIMTSRSAYRRRLIADDS